jgi:hypothetical protein
MIYQIESPNLLLTLSVKEKDFPLEKFSDRLFEIIKKYELATFKTEDGQEFKAVIHKRVDLETTTQAVVYAKEAISTYGYHNRRKTILQYKFEPK